MKTKRLYPRDLHSCPWCEGQPVIERLELTGEASHVFNIACERCYVVMYGDEGVTRSEMIRRWNERSPTPTPTLRSET